jgi:hypothetical protein
LREVLVVPVAAAAEVALGADLVVVFFALLAEVGVVVVVDEAVLEPEGGLAGVDAAGFIWMIFRARVGGGGSVMSAGCCCDCDVLRFLARAVTVGSAASFCSTRAGGGSVKVSMELD